MKNNLVLENRGTIPKLKTKASIGSGERKTAAIFFNIKKTYEKN